jgi:hypothetical protein
MSYGKSLRKQEHSVNVTGNFELSFRKQLKFLFLYNTQNSTSENDLLKDRKSTNYKENKYDHIRIKIFLLLECPKRSEKIQIRRIEKVSRIHTEMQINIKKTKAIKSRRKIGKYMNNHFTEKRKHFMFTTKLVNKKF